jgi:hypothetical protein
MCRLIMVGVGGAKSDATEPFRRRGLAAMPATNSTSSVLPAATALEIAVGGCSCDLYTCDASQDHVDGEKERRRYERKGWSAAKIDRALDASRAAAERPTVRRGRAEAFVAALQQLVTERAQITLLVHDFDGLFTEPFRVTGEVTIPISDFVASGGRFPEDTVVSLVA